MKRVRIKAAWTDDDSILKRLIAQFKTSDADTSNIEFVKDDTYDLIVFNNYINHNVSESAKSCIFFHEPTWAGSHQRNFQDIRNITIYGYDKNLYTPRESVVETPAHTFYGGRGDWVDSLDVWCYENISKAVWNKTKNISSVITSLNKNDGDGKPRECTYNTRYDIARSLIQNCSFIDFYGGWTGGGNLKTDPTKIATVKDYKFCISLENEFTKNWITEKFYDCILTNTVPIYYGCQNIKDIWPEDGYIILKDISDTHSIVKQIEYIHKNAEELYNQLLPGLLKIKSRYFEEFNPLKKINNLCA